MRGSVSNTVDSAFVALAALACSTVGCGHGRQAVRPAAVQEAKAPAPVPRTVVLPCPDGTLAGSLSAPKPGACPAVDRGADRMRWCHNPAGQRHGPYVSFRCGSVLERGSYIDGRKHGVWRRFHANGRTMSSYRYNHGVRHGPWTEWTAKGIRVGTGHYRRGRPMGPWVRSWRYGAGHAYTWFDGRGGSVITTVDAQGRKRGEVHYRSRFRHGPQRQWDANGRLLSHEIWRYDRLHKKLR